MTVDVVTGHITTDDGDLIPTTITVNVPAGASTVDFTVSNNQDTLAEGNENYSVALTGTFTGGNFENLSVDTTPVTTTIIDDEGTPSLTINDVTVDESAGTMTFTVTLSTASSGDVSFSYASADNGSALAGDDYTAVSGTGTITAGQTTTTITVPILDDNIDETAETFQLNLTAVTAGDAQIADGQGIGTITDEPTPGPEDTVLVSISGDTSVEEGEAPAAYVVTVSEAPLVDMTVDITYSYLSAETGDIVAATTQVTILAGSTSVPFTVATVDDAYAEGAEDFAVTISNPSSGGFEAAAVNPAAASVTTTINDESSPTSEDTATISLSGDNSVIEGNVATYTVSVDRIPLTDMVVSVQTGHVTTEDGDYEPLMTTVTIPAGQQTVSFTVTTTDDNLAEATESYTVTMTNVTGGGFENTVLGVSQVTTVITDEPVPGPEDTALVSIVGDQTIIEGNTSTVYTVSVDQSASDVTSPITVELTYSGVAVDGTDFTGVANVTIPAGSNSIDFNIYTLDDVLAEGSENFTITLGAITDSNFEHIEADSTANSVLTTIVDDSNPGTTEPTTETALVSITGDQTIVEGNTSTVYTVSIDQPASDVTSPITIELTYSGVAVDGTDFTGVANVTIPADSNSVGFNIATLDDVLAEGSENFTITLGSITDSNFENIEANSSANSVVTTIVDDSNPGTTEPTTETALVSIAGDQTITEGETSTAYTVSVDQPASDVTSPITVELTYSGVAVDGTDFTGVANVTIPVGSSSVDFNLSTIDDATWENSESFTITIGNITDSNFENIEADSSANSVVTTILDNDPAISDTSATVSEEGLASGIADSNAASGHTDVTDSASISGTVTVGDPAVNSLVLTTPTTSFSSGGQAVTWTGNGTQTLTATANGSDVATVNIDNSGNYTFTLLGPVDHGSTGEDSLDISFGVVGAGGSSPVTASLSITIEDDAPVATSSSAQDVVVTDTDTNLLLIVDVSGSMGGTRLQLAQQSLNGLIDGYENNGDVRVRIVTFSKTATELGTTWVDGDTAKGILSSLIANGSTNYDAALSVAMSAFADAGKLVDAQNISYFLSDGAPNRSDGNTNVLGTGSSGGNSDDGIQPVEEGIWESFLEDNNINSLALGMGTGVSAANLNPIAYNGSTSEEANAIIVTDINQLDGVLQSTIVEVPFEGNFLSGSLQQGGGFGADGGYLQQITIDGTTYVYDQANNQVLVGGALFAAGTEFTVTTVAGGELTMNMLDGSYTYLAGDTQTLPSSEVFDFTVVDMDGDTASASLTLNVIEQDRVAGTDQDDVLTGSAGQDQLLGGAGSDTLSAQGDDDLLDGGAGNDILSGSTGDDLFIWSAGDEGTSVAPAVDTVTDFAIFLNPGDETDVLDLSDLLQGESAASLDQYLHFEQSGSDTVVYVKTDGGIDGTGSNADQTIILNGVTDLNAGTQTDAEIIQQLLDNNQLIVD
jgi:T1SS-143 domain-containing protein